MSTERERLTADVRDEIERDRKAEYHLLTKAAIALAVVAAVVVIRLMLIG